MALMNWLCREKFSSCMGALRRYEKELYRVFEMCLHHAEAYQLHIRPIVAARSRNRLHCRDSAVLPLFNGTGNCAGAERRSLVRRRSGWVSDQVGTTAKAS